MASNKDLEKVQPRSITVWPQWLAAHTLSLAVIVSGLANGWASPYLAQLTSTEADMPLRLTSTEASWVASLLNLGRLIGALLGALCQERRRTVPFVKSLFKNKAATTQRSSRPVLEVRG
ncbi:hypothetical protein KM043_011385 [Ampulex compressa]|nr:hypothetical protein KM043_011385 [Ampulex compressa]